MKHGSADKPNKAAGVLLLPELGRPKSSRTRWIIRTGIMGGVEACEGFTCDLGGLLAWMRRDECRRQLHACSCVRVVGGTSTRGF